jgi:hypothetical protein
LSIYRNIVHQKDWQQSFQQIKVSLFGKQAWKAILVILLMLVNWSFEALKWRILIRHIQKISFFRAFRAILSGLSVSLAMNTPNGSGEYVGRILYVKEGNRIRAITLTFVGSMSQLIVTMLLGTIGLFLISSHFYSATKQIFVLSLPVVNYNYLLFDCYYYSFTLCLFRNKLAHQAFRKNSFCCKIFFFHSKARRVYLTRTDESIVDFILTVYGICSAIPLITPGI